MEYTDLEKPRSSFYNKFRRIQQPAGSTPLVKLKENVLARSESFEKLIFHRFLTIFNQLQDHVSFRRSLNNFSAINIH